MTTKRYIIEMDDQLASVLKNSGQVRLQEISLDDPRRDNYSSRHERQKHSHYLQHVQNRTKPLRFRPGTFDYSGFGQGTYWNAKGETVDTTRSEAAAMARAEGVPFKVIDRLTVSSDYSHDWPKHALSDEE